MSNTLEIQQGEGKWIKFTVTRKGVSLNLSSAVLFFGMKVSMQDPDYAYKVEDGAWDKSEAGSGVVRCNIPASVTKELATGKYEAQARFIVTADTDVDKTQKLAIIIGSAVIAD